MNTLHDRAVLRSKGEAFDGGVTFVIQHRDRMSLFGQTMPQAHQDRFRTVVT